MAREKAISILITETKQEGTAPEAAMEVAKQRLGLSAEDEPKHAKAPPTNDTSEAIPELAHHGLEWLAELKEDMLKRVESLMTILEE